MTALTMMVLADARHMTVVMSATGFFEAEMSSDSFQLLGMAEMVMIPAIFAHRSKHGTPTFSILCSATGVVILSFMSFQEIIEFLINFLYGLRMLVMFAAFIKLHAKNPDLPRPYRIPVGTAGAAAMCVPPVALITTAGAVLRRRARQEAHVGRVPGARAATT
ncbi:hypothetical protein SETIT_5G167000v2 [Setaria italica]|uniref:Amino acid permease/ SLC12A domain-containing protein n=1 Tax=Setaria italica TaxID=4555 RepID=A0A368R5N0_SETIT|nr:probable polyamine transporter At3g19553 [Setaria italica]RCV25443.1 hypothetical protein SETIT_5G167000v2 [Setaria italica]